VTLTFDGQADQDVEPAERADGATVHAFLNCYLREIGDYTVSEEFVGGVEPGPEGLLQTRLPEQGIDVLAPLEYRSPTERHLFEPPIRYRLPDGPVCRADAATLASLVVKDLALERACGSVPAELLERVLRSKQNVELFVRARKDDDACLYDEQLSFRDAEQALVFGHHRHPTPKSRQGIAARNRETYTPELRGSFPLHYFRADPDLVASDSALDQRATTWAKDALRDDDSVSAAFVEEHVDSGDALLPVHPWQAEYLLDQPHVRRHLGDGIEHLGAVGRKFYPTTSVRTLYAPDAPFMVKSSLHVQITNSVRTNKRPELDRGVAVASSFDDFEAVVD